MNTTNSIDTSVLDGIIIGRVDPHIYAFSTETIPNYLKVGDTYRSVEVRLDEWRRHFPKLKQIYDHTARTDDRRIFRDYSVHTFLENERNRKRLTKNLFPKEYYSNEFFEKATKKDVEDAIADICRDAKRNTGKYQFYDENHLPETYTYERKDDYKPRKNQQETIDKFKDAVAKKRKKLLMYAVMRFGKSFTSMCCADEMKADLVVVVSAKADVKEEWKKTVESHKRFVQYEFATSENLKSNKKFISESKEARKKIVLFLTLQDLQGKEMKDKHDELFKTKIDLLLVDESHFGARATEYGRVLQDYKLTTKQLKAERQKEVSLDELNDGLKVLNADVTMHLSGTPYRILMSDEFTNDDIVAFYQFSDIVDDKEKWDREHIDNDVDREWDNPYYGFPQMVRFAFNPCQSAVKKLNALKNAGVSYAMSELLKPQSISKDEKNNAHKKFVHAAEVLDLFKVIDGSKTDENVLGFLDYDKIKQGQMCRHIVIVLPFRASCDALEKMIADNKKMFKNLNDYQIVNIAGVDGDKTYKDIKDVKNKIQTCEAKGQKTITLTVNRMLTGSTV
ncbi:MAG: DEAD/DEAH box helicase family protein, partial [Bacteroidales bacterium]|nr:DEAD/DEAH box helicase family protein [Bacteroidales bacterium]